MGQGGLSKALIIVSKAKGWDPTRIWDSKTQTYGDDIRNFDKSPEVFVNQKGTGALPQGTPDSFPDATDSPLSPALEETPFNTTLQSANKSRATKNSDPFAGIGGAGG